MKPGILFAACIFGLASLVRAVEQPNILFIFADDMSYETIGAHGMLDIDTPHLDTLVEKAMDALDDPMTSLTAADYPKPKKKASK